MIGRLVENDEVRRMQCRQSEQESRLFTAGESSNLLIGCGPGKADGTRSGAHLLFRSLRHERADMLIHALGLFEFIKLMLGKVADAELVGTGNPARERRKALREELCQ